MAVIEGYPPQRRLRRAPARAAPAIRPRRFARSGATSGWTSAIARELYEAIDSLPLRPEHEALIGISAFHTVRAAIDVFDEILAAVIEPAAVEVTG